MNPNVHLSRQRGGDRVQPRAMLFRSTFMETLQASVHVQVGGMRERRGGGTRYVPLACSRNRSGVSGPTTRFGVLYET